MKMECTFEGNWILLQNWLVCREISPGNRMEQRSRIFTVVGQMMTIMSMQGICFSAWFMLLQKSIFAY